MSLQFSPLEGLHVGHLGLLWGSSFKGDYPLFNSSEAIPHLIEQFGVVSRDRPKIQLMEKMPAPRLMLASEDQQYLVQLQNDRLTLNWRKLSEASGKINEYPRFEATSARLKEEWGRLKNYISENGLGEATIDQVEFTYVNHIDVSCGQLSEIFKDVFHETRFPENVSFESITHNLRHIISHKNKKIGRLHTSVEKGFRSSDNKDVYVLKFVARVHPLDDSLVETLELLRGTINSAFKDITTERMHKAWEVS